MPFKHFIQKIEGRLPQYTTPEPTGKPKFPYTFEFEPFHRMREFILGEYNSDEERITTISEAFLWRATPQGHDYWAEWAEYDVDELPSEQMEIINEWVEQYDLTLEEEYQEESIRSSDSDIWVDDIGDVPMTTPTTRVPF